MRDKKRIAVLFGGKSAEHEISIISAKNIMAAMSPDKYMVVAIGVDKAGNWYLQNREKIIDLPDDPKQVSLPDLKTKLGVIPGNGNEQIFDLGDGSPLEPVDIFFPILHGPFGEDGSLQGMLKLMDVPFVGPDVTASAIGMDKDLMKKVLKAEGIPNSDFVTCYKSDEFPDYQQVKDQLGLPMFIKPANMGSSVGISKVTDEESFKLGVEDAFRFDDKIVIEQFIKGREIEIAVLGNLEPKASVPGEIIPKGQFYSYESKYIDETGAELVFPAKDMDEILINRLKDTAIRVYKILGCAGLSRVDFFVTEDETIYVNEINTLPGFTQISMYPKLWELEGVKYGQLIDKLLDLAVDAHEHRAALKTSYQ